MYTSGFSTDFMPTIKFSLVCNEPSEKAQRYIDMFNESLSQYGCFSPEQLKDEWKSFKAVFGVPPEIFFDKILQIKATDGIRATYLSI